MNPHIVGDVVKCVWNDPFLTLGEWYTITHVYPHTVRVAEAPFDWYWDRFDRFLEEGEIA